MAESQARQVPEATSMRRVGRDAVVYGAGMIAQRAASFLLLPVYTRLLTPTDYGLMDLLDLTVEVVSILVSAGTMAGVLRFYYKAEDERARREVIGSSYVLLGALNALGAVLLVIFASPIYRVGLRGQGSIWFLYLVAAQLLLSTATIVPQSYMRAAREPHRFVVSSVTILVLKLTLNIILVFGLRLGVLGVLLSGLASSLVGGVWLSVWLVRKIGLPISRRSMQELRRFGVPFQIAQAGGFILTFGDRFFLQGLRGTATVGIYGLAYRFGFLTAIATSPILDAWTPQRFQIASLPRAERDARYNRGFNLYSMVLLSVAVALSTGARPLLRIMSDPAFWPAASLVPVIVAAYVVQAWTQACRFGIEVSERTVFHTLSVWVSVAVILAAYVILIPRYGATGAALATLFSFLVRFALTYVFAQRLWPVTLEWRPHLMLLTVSAGATVGFSLLPTTLPVWVDLLASGMADAVTVLAAAFLLFDEEDRREGLRVALLSARRFGSALRMAGGRRGR